jgi:hypothetical protein
MMEFERDLIGACVVGTFLWAVLLGGGVLSLLF